MADWSNLFFFQGGRNAWEVSVNSINRGPLEAGDAKRVRASNHTVLVPLTEEVLQRLDFAGLV